jgi:hypothetical protein
MSATGYRVRARRPADASNRQNASVDLRTEMRYPGATVAQVRALALDADFRRTVCQATGAIAYDVDVAGNADGSAGVTVSRTLPATVPDFAKRFVGETIEVVQKERWSPADDSPAFRAELWIDVVGQPASLRGTIRIETVADGAVEIVEGDVRVSIPLIGRTFEAELAQGIVAAARREEELGREWLSSGRP